MQVAVFDSHRYDQAALTRANRRFDHCLQFFEPRLNLSTAPLAHGFEVVCPFVNCRLDAATLGVLNKGGTRMVALRAAGFNGIDLPAARQLGMVVARVPAYSPHAVAEHAFALLLSLVRKTHRAYNRVRDANFSLDGLVGFDLHGKTFGLVGAGRIGRVAAKIAVGFGCRVLICDPQLSAEDARILCSEKVDFSNLLSRADIISLHLPLTSDTQHLFDSQAFSQCKSNALLVNTSRGGLIHTSALIDALKSKRLGGVALDVYELEEGVFFENLSESGIADDHLARLMTFPNVLITSHQGFLTEEALDNIAETTLENIRAFAAGDAVVNAIA
ncbi:2-hydroxyacid dehydrogenase [Chitinimonas arctica]|uniref:2-hydroxyacid dehydrogenase n=1 Tax=Chitinimonas arctica TaxID=2594795 RepID=A0A516SCQ5_9NEIS|nr:2-hydroxyacid dehydrogenase [Chitinimonas arctica]QDQ25838.1 2-hydroxyacid dehydrogenase [Chitinimonas arctica]